MTSDSGVQVYVPLPNYASIGGETFWADQVGISLYRIANVPLWAYGLNYHDVVRATPDAEGILTIDEVVESSGHRTLRLMFPSDIGAEQQGELLRKIYQPGGVTFERANGSLVAINIAPESDYLSVFDQLEAWADSGLLDFETFHARVEGSFDDAP
ncbi:DUF4265 domain-containing protein [Rhodopirellula halodulae]|uniref:DUF4265 domain-containing protein n=1 Tax=Rhodopirellula halodulae TaxID=2894198 RepID=UPI001E28AF32|nr:DUF4265 domain-containing protein [Rhodopirellula sp. JC737]MCC9657983.1 DUF4265 domain-containing protein [Rhodopirellula sp. JC737]